MASVSERRWPGAYQSSASRYVIVCPVEASSAVLRAAETPRESGLSISVRVRRSENSATTPAVSSVDPSLMTITSRAPATKLWSHRHVRLTPIVASAFFAAMTTLTTGAGIGSFLRPDTADGRRVRGFRELARLGCCARPNDRRGGRRTESGEQVYASVHSCSLGVLPPALVLADGGSETLPLRHPDLGKFR